MCIPVWAVPVTFNDSNLLAALCAQYEVQVGVSLSNPPLDSELANPLFTSLDARYESISDLTGLEACTALTDLNLAYNNISDLSPLSGLTALRRLDLGFGGNLFEGDYDIVAVSNQISDLIPLAGLVNLEYLNLGGNPGITTIAPLSSLSNLNEFFLGSDAVTDWSPLASWIDSLQTLALINDGIADADMPIVASLTHLSILGIVLAPGVSDISGLSGLDLHTAAFVFTSVSDISVASNWPDLTAFSAPGSPVISANGLEHAAGLEYVSMFDCSLVDISALNGLANINYLYLMNNHIVDISALATITGIQVLDISNNQITDIQALVDNPGLGTGDFCSLMNNPLSDHAACDELPLLRAKFNNGDGVQSDAICGSGVTLTITVTGTGNTSPGPGAHLYSQGDVVMVNALPVSGSGWAFDHWAGAASGMQTCIQITMDGDKSIEAVFVTPGDYTITIEHSGTGSGYTLPEPGVYSFLSGRPLNIFASPAHENYFGGWQGDVTGYNPNLNLIADGDKTIIAVFVSSGYTLTTHITGQGSTSLMPGTYDIGSGAEIELSALETTAGWVFDHWEGDIGDANPVLPTLQVTMDQDRDITAVFSQVPTHTLTITVDGTGQGTTQPEPGIHTFNEGVTQWLYAIPDAGSAFDHWEGDIGDTDPHQTRFSILMDQDRTMTAIFAPADWQLTILKTGNGSTNPAPGIHGYLNGTDAPINAVLLSGGDAFDRWSGDLNSSMSPENPSQMVTMDRNRTVTAQYTQGDWTLTIAQAGSGSGSITPGIGTFSYLDGRNASVNAWTNSGSYFAGWTGDIISNNPTLIIQMDGNKNITANYSTSGYTLTLATTGEGVINFHTPDAYCFASGLVVTVEVRNTSSGWVFDHWSGDIPEGAVASAPSLQVPMDQDRNIMANFRLDVKTLTIIIEGTGETVPDGSPSPGTQYTFATGQCVSLTAQLGTAGWAFSHWSGDIGSADPASQYYSLTMDQDRTVVATYVSADWTMTLAYTGNGAIYPAPGNYGFLDGANVEAVANIVSGGDAFSDWEGLPEGQDPNEAAHHFVIHSDLNLTAVFATGDYILTTTIAGGGTAEYVSHPAGSYQYLAGRAAGLEVRPNSSTYWGGYAGDVTTFDYTASLLMNSHKNVTIYLGTSGYELVINKDGGGITSPSGTVRYVAGIAPIIHAIDQGSSLFEQWTGDLSPGANPYGRGLQILMDQNRSITAIFEEADWYLYLQVTGNGTTNPAPDVLHWFRDGDPFDVTATLGADALFLHWQGDVPIGQDPTSLTISGTMTQNRELIAVFVPATVIVPDLSGKTQAEAEGILFLAGLILGEVTEEYSSITPAGQIIAQDPLASTVVDYGSVVSIVVSLGPCYTSIPNVVGLTQAEAETALTAANLALGTVSEENSDFVSEGQVISQQPVSGLVVACESIVNIVISLGPALPPCHTADQDCDNQINLSELLRVIQFYNSSGYHCQVGTEDGYAPGLTGDHTCTAHSSDYNPQDWQISLSELLRLIQFYNSGGYHVCEGSEDGFCPGVGAD